MKKEALFRFDVNVGYCLSNWGRWACALHRASNYKALSQRSWPCKQVPYVEKEQSAREEI